MRRWREGLGGRGGEGLFVGRLLVEEIRYLTTPETALKSSKGYECHWSICMHENLGTFSRRETL